MKYFPGSLIIFILPVFFLIVFLPLLSMFFGSFWSKGPTLANYSHLLNVRYLKIAAGSLYIATGTTVLSLLIGVLQAFILQRTDISGKGFFNIAYLVPLLVPPYIHAIVWTDLLGKTGIFNQYMGQFTGFGKSFLSIYGIHGVIFVLTLAYTPFVTACVICGLKTMDHSLEEAALLHHTPFQVNKKVTLPLLFPHIFCGAMFVFVFSLINFGVPDLLRVRVYPTEIFIQFSAFFNEKTATAMSVPLVIICILFILSIKKIMKNRSFITITGGSTFNPDTQTDSIYGGGVAFLFVFLIFILSAAVPCIVLIVKCGSFTNYIHALEQSLGEIGYSMIISLSGALVMVIFSFLISYLMEREKRLSALLDYATLIPFAVPATVLGIGLIKTWNREFTRFIYGTSLISIIAYTAHYVPFTIRIVLADLKNIDTHLEEAAFLTTPHWWRVIRKITLPLIRPGILISFFIGFIFCFGDLSTTLLVIPPGRETVSIKIYNILHYGAENMVAALCLVVISVILITGGLFYLSFRLMDKK